MHSTDAREVANALNSDLQETVAGRCHPAPRPSGRQSGRAAHTRTRYATTAPRCDLSERSVAARRAGARAAHARCTTILIRTVPSVCISRNE
eukprot:6208564-Pleurochrysis_carterae.AAC.5